MKTVAKLLILFLGASSFVFGCSTMEGTSSKTKKTKPVIFEEKPVLSDIELQEKIRTLSNRIQEFKALKEKLQKEGDSDIRVRGDLQQTLLHAESLLKTYEKIHQLQRKLSQHQPQKTGEKTHQKMIKELFQELIQLENGYFADRYKVWFAEEHFLKQYKLDLQEMERHCANEDYRELIVSYKNVKARYGEESIPANIKYCCAKALARRNQVEEAIRVTENMIDKEPVNSPEVRSYLIDWYLETNNLEKALSNFEELTREIDKGMDRYLMAEKKVASPIRGKLDEPIKKLAVDEIFEEAIRLPGAPEKELHGKKDFKPEIKKETPKESKDEKRTPFEKELENADRFIKEKRFEEARSLLMGLEERMNTAREIEAIENAFGALKFEEDKAKQETEETERFLLAKRLMESEKYEEAIKKLNTLRESERYARESQERIQSSIDEFARKKREKAAGLFLLAKKKTDQDEKKELLLKSLNLLEEVIEKYPTSTYSGKIIMNIETIKQEILKIGPHSFQNKS